MGDARHRHQIPQTGWLIVILNRWAAACLNRFTDFFKGPCLILDAALVSFVIHHA